MADKQKVFA